MILSEDDILRSLSNDNTIQEKMSRFFDSREYRETVRQVSENNAQFSHLPESLKLVSLFLSHAGFDCYLKDMHTLLYKRKPPTIEEYLTEEHGGAVMEKLYDGWKKVILRDFHSSFIRQTPNELVFSGSIGSGKTTVARLLKLWLLIRVCMLRNPQATLNVTQETLLVMALFTVTLDKASLALIKPFISLLDQSPHFQAVGKPSEFNDFSSSPLIPYVVRQKYIEFPNNVIINLGSTVEHAISYSMFGALLDEAEWGAGGVERAFAIYTNLRERVRSRFLGSSFTLMSLVSSSRYTKGIIAEYIKNTDPNDPSTKIYSFPIWEIKHFDAYKDKGNFYVFVGNKNNPHRILPEDEAAQYEGGSFVLPKGCQVIKVPEVYKKDFQSRLGEALKNLAGIAVDADSTYIFDEDPIECNELCPEFEIYSDLGNNDVLFDRIPESVFNKAFGGIRFKIAPEAPRYLHLDLAETGTAGLTLLHPETHHDRSAYVVDLLVTIKTNTKIDLTAVYKLIEKISECCHIASFTTDQYQSTHMRQQAQLDGIADEIGLQSVVKSTEPYETASRIVQNKQLFTGNCPKLKRQLGNVQITEGGKVYQSTAEGEHGDVGDSLAGALFRCIMDFDKSVRYRVEDWWNKPKVEPAKMVETSMQGFNSL